MKQAQKVQQRMENIQKELADSLIEVEAGGGAVSITIGGDQVFHTIKIKPEIVDKNDVEGLEDLILTAVNQAVTESKKYADERTKELTGDINLPEGLGF